MDPEQLTFLRQLIDTLAFVGNDPERFKTQKATLDALFIKGRKYTISDKNRKPHLQGLTQVEQKRLWYHEHREEQKAKNLARYYKRKEAKKVVETPEQAANTGSSTE